MTGKDLLTAMSGIDGRYIEEAAPAATPKRRSLRRPLLIAAAIAAALLLVGCGIVYALRLQDMSIGKATYTQRFDDKGKAISGSEKDGRGGSVGSGAAGGGDSTKSTENAS